MTTPDKGQGAARGWEPPSTAAFNMSNQPRLGIWMSNQPRTWDLDVKSTTTWDLDVKSTTTWDLDEMTHISLPTFTLEKCWDSLLVNSPRKL